MMTILPYLNGEDSAALQINQYCYYVTIYSIYSNLSYSLHMIHYKDIITLLPKLIPIVEATASPTEKFRRLWIIIHKQ